MNPLSPEALVAAPTAPCGTAMSSDEFSGLLASAPLDQFVNWLDAAGDKPALYLTVWRRLMRAIGASVHLCFDGHIQSGLGMEEPLAERHARFDALLRHLVQSGHRDALAASLKAGQEVRS